MQRNFSLISEFQLSFPKKGKNYKEVEGDKQDIEEDETTFYFMNIKEKTVRILSYTKSEKVIFYCILGLH